MSENNSTTDIFSTPKIGGSGDGDGIKKVTTRTKIPFPSSRKFNANIPCGNMKLKLEQALTDLQKPKKHNCLTKAQTVAEITPSKTKLKKKTHSELDLNEHDTRRSESSNAVDASRRCNRDRVVCKIYGYLLVHAWRRCKTRLQTLSDLSGRQLNQITQLEIQVNFLKTMRQSECEKREEAIRLCQLAKNNYNVMKEANSTLIQDLESIQKELSNTKEQLKLTKYDLKNRSEQLAKSQETLIKRKEEKMDLIAQIESQKEEILAQNAIILELQQKQYTTEMNLHNIKSSLEMKENELNEVKQQVETETKNNVLLNDTISSLQKSKFELQEHLEDLEDELQQYISNIEEIQYENVSIREDLEEVKLMLSTEKNKKWIKITRELSLLSLSALKKITKVVLEVYHMYHMY
ncbi:uncharacterized protein LOC130903904 [Diorhabda carinulata]|uniref:uncharacterized protein LOC130903904 n=1 Tax=Diorhabda carinulata TaxID=1163345 RepID=UPI0025A2266F|nr:uncharacterized protein LOC130903904 [Diorhabda carinulata]XP_057672264.1 uncharacterized protein LOC130903904 [Diorhabda carinulata]